MRFLTPFGQDREHATTRGTVCLISAIRVPRQSYVTVHGTMEGVQDGKEPLLFEPYRDWLLAKELAGKEGLVAICPTGDVCVLKNSGGLHLDLDTGETIGMVTFLYTGLDGIQRSTEGRSSKE